MRMPQPEISHPVLVWDGAEMLECVTVTPEAPNVASFCFQSPTGAIFSFVPGQFLTLELPLPKGTLHRTFTISSSPSRPMSISVTVKAQPGSLGTRWMLDHLKPGMRIRATRPAGRFSSHHHPSEKYLFISAGSGITPLMSSASYLNTDSMCALLKCKGIDLERGFKANNASALAAVLLARHRARVGQFL